jgi:hypothetical protein
VPVALDTRRLVAIALAVAAIAFVAALLVGKASGGSGGSAVPTRVTPASAPAKVKGISLPSGVPAMRPAPHVSRPSTPTVTEASPATSTPAPSAPSGGSGGGGGGGVIVG